MGRPMKRGRGATMTHDYKRHGTTTLFAALDVTAGTVIGQCMLRHRAAEFIRFLRLIDRQTPAELDLHLILNNDAAHKTEAVQRWLAQHPRFHIHVTPTSASWINAVEGLFATLTQRRLKRGVFRSVIELNQAIPNYLDTHNADPKPFRWTAPTDTIIGKHQRGKRLLESLHSRREPALPPAPSRQQRCSRSCHARARHAARPRKQARPRSSPCAHRGQRR
jgi:hypothetical protein